MSQWNLLAMASWSLLAADPRKVPTERTLAVVLLNFRNDDRQPIDVEEVRRRVFLDSDSTRAFFREQSYGLVDLVGRSGPQGEVFGWYTIDAFNRPCAEAEWAAAALAAAAGTASIPPGTTTWSSSFPRRTPAPTGARGSIRGRTPGSTGPRSPPSPTSWDTTWGRRTPRPAPALAADGARVVLSGSCTDIEYGNPFDVMGAGFRHTNAYNKAQAGWLPAANVRRVEQSGRYLLLPQERPASGVQLLAIRRDASTFYYLEYRQPFGFDDFSADDPITQGVVVLLAGRAGRGRQLVPARPHARDTDACSTRPWRSTRTYRDIEAGRDHDGPGALCRRRGDRGGARAGNRLWWRRLPVRWGPAAGRGAVARPAAGPGGAPGGGAGVAGAGGARGLDRRLRRRSRAFARRA